MADNLPRLDVRNVAGLLRRRALAIAALVGITFVVVYGLSDLRTSVYSASSEVRFSGSTEGTLRDEEDDRDGETFSPGNEIYLIQSPQVRTVVNQSLGRADASRVRQVGVIQLPETDVLRISVSSTSPEVAKEAADLYAETYVALRQDDLRQGYETQIQRIEGNIQRLDEQIDALAAQIAADPDSLEAQGAQQLQASLIQRQSDAYAEVNDLAVQAEQQASVVRVAKEAGTPTLPDSPTPLRDAGIAALIALVVGVGAVFLFEQLDTRLKSREEIVDVAGGVAVLGSLPVHGGKVTFWQRLLRRQPVAPRRLVDPTSIASEAYRALATSLRFSDIRAEKRRLLITSSLPGEGKTTVTGNLAAVLAENGLKVVVVSADLRRPQLGAMLDVEDIGPGLSSVMLGDEKLRDVLKTVTVSFGVTFTVLPSGALPHEPSVLLGSDEFGDILDQFEKAGADFILIDCAPVLPVSDPLAVVRHVDGVLLTMRFARTRRAELAHAVERLQKVDADIVGIVANGVTSQSEGETYLNQYGYAGDV